MKRLFLILAIAAMFFSSCSNKVDLYNNDGDTTVIYAMLDPFADTNFFKITHSFVGNALEMAQDPSNSNYQFNEIEVTLTGVFKDSGASQTILLDTISKWIPYNPEATYYSGCYQRYYYTTKQLLEGHEYNVNVLRKADNVNVTAKTSTVNHIVFQKPVYLSFSPNSHKSPVEWRVNEAPFVSNASYFDVVAYFRYSELMPGSTELVHRSIQWNMGSGEASSLYVSNASLPYYKISYAPAALYTILANDKYLKNNSPSGVQRFFEDFRFTVNAYGKEMYEYYLATHSSSAIQDVPNYTNIENGMGLVSSCVTIIRDLPIDQDSRDRIRDEFPSYHFYSSPN